MNNTVTRTLSGVVFLAVVLGGLLIHPYLFALLLLLMMVGMMHEFYALTMGKSYPAARILFILSGVLLFAGVFASRKWGMPTKYLPAALVPLYAALIQSLYVKDKSAFGGFSHLFTGFVYIAIPLAVSNLLVFNREGVFSGRLILSFFILIWASDVGAYCFGMLFGKNGRKLFPSISPKKSWAGFWGGLACAVLAALILRWTGLISLPWYHCAVLAVVMNVAGTFGDLFESEWKRHYDVKDSGTCIPGHGGLLDRFDSALFAIPAGALYLILSGLL